MLSRTPRHSPNPLLVIQEGRCVVEGMLVRALLHQNIWVVGKAGATVASRRDKRKRQYAHLRKATEGTSRSKVVESFKSIHRLRGSTHGEQGT